MLPALCSRRKDALAVQLRVGAQRRLFYLNGFGVLAQPVLPVRERLTGFHAGVTVHAADREGAVDSLLRSPSAEHGADERNMVRRSRPRFLPSQTTHFRRFAMVSA